jgi:hypothetical protein
MAATRGNSKAAARQGQRRKDCGRNNQLEVMGAAMDDSNDW